MKFEPSSIERFEFAPWTWNPQRGELKLRYRLDDLEFVETVRFVGGQSPTDPALQAGLERCFDLVHLLAGVSYYKAAVPPRVVFQGPPPDPMMAAFAERVYRNGLGEFAFENRLDLGDRIRIPCGETQDQDPTLALDSGIVVALGGGKDSLVSVETLRASGQPFRVISVGQSALIDEVAALTGVDHVRIERSLDPTLFELNEAGAYNGHVPISAILAAIMAAGAVLYGYDHVVMSNEQSAEAANVVLDDGFEVNHQYSKSLRFENDFQNLLTSRVLPGLHYFSLLRPLSELEIARRFAGLRQYHRVFSSCNRNFRLRGSGSPRWCRDCPKCRFVFLALAPFVDPEDLIGLFGGNLLDDADQLGGYRELLGLDGIKPFECVGEVEESRSAMAALARDVRWQHDRVVAELSRQLEPAPPLDEWLALRGSDAMPQGFRDLIDAHR